MVILTKTTMNCLLVLAFAFLFCIESVEAQRELQLTKNLQTVSQHISSIDHKRNLMNTISSIGSHPFAQILHGLNQADKNAAINQLKQVVEALNGSVSSFCFEDLNYFVTSIENYVMAYLNGSVEVGKETEFALRQLDAFGKLPPGILEGNTMFFGSYEECLRIDFLSAQTNRQYQGKFCTTYISIQNGTACPRDLIDGFSPSSHIYWNWCLPNSCTNDDLPHITQTVTLQNSSIAACGITCLEREFPMNTGAILWTSVFGVILTLVIFGSSLDCFWYQPKLIEAKSIGGDFHPNSATQAILAFSIYSNGVSVMDMTQRPGQIHCINCIRVFCTVWIMMGHCYDALLYANNLMDVLELPKEIIFLTVSNAYFSVDSFFFLSGLLLGFLFFKEMSKRPELIKKPSTWIMFYVHRYLRLTPLYAFILFAYATMLPYWSGGIFWRQNDITSKMCSTSWWTNLLYINIYVERDNTCFGVAWYLAADMQMHVFAPIVLIALWKSPVLGFAVSGPFFFLSTAANFYTNIHNHLSIQVLGSPRDPEELRDAYFEFYYDAPWIRFVPYLQGLLLGYILFKNGDKQVRIPWLVNIIGWIASLCLMLTCIYGLYYTAQGHLLDLWIRASYNALSKPAWGFGLCWIVFSCYYGYGGVIGKFLSWRIWLPFSRLTYAAFLIQEITLYLIPVQGNQPLHWSGHIDWITMKLIPLVVVSFFFAFFASIMVEIPFGKLEKQLFEPRKRQNETKSMLPRTWNITVTPVPDQQTENVSTQIKY